MTLFLISASLVNAQCVPACTGGASCQVDTETGTYHCVGGGGGGGTNTSITFTNPLSFDTVEGFLASVLSTIRGIIVVLSIIFIIIGGIFYITSAGSESRMKVAKAAITASMIGLAIGIAAPSFLQEISTILGWTGTSDAIPAGTLTLSQIALNFLNFLLSIVGVLAIIMLVVGGIMYLSSAGDDDRIKTAKNIVTYSIIGIIVSLAALVIVTQIATLLSQ
jgi:fumarate reductase subunit D